MSRGKVTKGRKFYAVRHARISGRGSGCGRRWKGESLSHSCQNHRGGFCCCPCGAWDETPKKRRGP